MRNKTNRSAARQPSGSRPSAGRSGRGKGLRRGAAHWRGGVKGVLLKLSDLLSTPRGLAMVIGGFLVLALIIVGVGLISSGGGRVDAVSAPGRVAADKDAADEAAAEDGEALSGDTAGEGAAAPTAEAGVDPTPQPRAEETWRDGAYAPQPQGENYLPVFHSAERQDKVVAVTVDDCFQTDNLRQILRLAEDVGGKLTIFPIGELLQRDSLQQAIRDAHANGHEIENHTWSHDGLYNFSAQKLANHIFNQDRALDLVLDVNYYTHFLRPRGGDDRNDLRTHAYINQLGYYGIAHWSVNGALSVEKLEKALEPGAVYLFHCTDDDLEKLRRFIPYAAGQGYRLVTMNEMFGYAANYVEPLTDDPMSRSVVQLEPYERDYKTIRATTYDYAVYEVQAALKKAGYLKSNPDGIYGKTTAKYAAKWQKDNGYNPDGVLTPEQQRRLLGAE